MRHRAPPGDAAYGNRALRNRKGPTHGTDHPAMPAPGSAEDATGGQAVGGSSGRRPRRDSGSGHASAPPTRAPACRSSLHDVQTTAHADHARPRRRPDAPAGQTSVPSIVGPSVHDLTPTDAARLITTTQDLLATYGTTDNAAPAAYAPVRRRRSSWPAKGRDDRVLLPVPSRCRHVEPAPHGRAGRCAPHVEAVMGSVGGERIAQPDVG